MQQLATQSIPVTIKDPAKWLKRREERRTTRRPRVVNYPNLKPGESVVAIRRHHGGGEIVIQRAKHPNHTTP